MRIAVIGIVVALAACSKAPDQGNAPAQQAATAQTAGQAQHLPKIPLRVRHGDGRADSNLSVELALTPAQQERGLMYRTALKPDEGMIFPMVPPRSATFWMKDTFVPLDLLFIRTDGTVEKLIANAKPHDETPLFAEVPVSAVLELPGGRAAALGIDIGDRISWGACTIEAHAGIPQRADNFCPG